MIERADELQDTEKAVAWFYRLLRNAVIDHARSRSAGHRRDDAWAKEASPTAEQEEREICRCFEALVPTLRPNHAELLRVELQGESVATAAHALGLTPNNGSVTLHRARAELRAKLVNFCGPCASSACLDCDCE